MTRAHAIAIAIVAALVFATVGRAGLTLSMSELKDAQIECSDLTATPILAAFPSGATRADSMYIATNTTACVHIGGRGVTNTSGLSIGFGCRDGIGTWLDSRLAWCIAEGAEGEGEGEQFETVDVDYGVR